MECTRALVGTQTALCMLSFEKNSLTAIYKLLQCRSIPKTNVALACKAFRTQFLLALQRKKVIIIYKHITHNQPPYILNFCVIITRHVYIGVSESVTIK